MTESDYLVVFTYKGNQDLIVIRADEHSLYKEFRRKVKKGEIDEIYPPGYWHYDPETLVPTIS